MTPPCLDVTSSLHALMDVLGELPQPGDLVAIDEFAYPITEWAALRAAARGVEVRRYRHHRPGRLVPPAGGRLVLVADGWCPGCNRPAPLASGMALGVLLRADHSEREVERLAGALTSLARSEAA